MSGEFSFPFPPYDIQQRFMQHLYQVLENRKIGIFESPTGTGKSLSLLCSTLKFLKDHEEKTENGLKTEIEKLNIEILSCIGKSDDWIEEQYQLIQKKQQLYDLQTSLDKMNEYNQKIRDIRNKIQEKEKTLIIRQRLHDNSDTSDLLDNDEDSNEIDDLLITEVESDSDDESELEKPADDFRPLQIFFCSRTHSQLSQLVGEVKSTVHSKQLRSVSLASRQNYCINKTVKQLRNNNLINERCLELQKNKSKSTHKDADKNATKLQKLSIKSCPYYKKNLESLRNKSLTTVMDIEELVKAGIEEKSCPYYSSRAAVSDSQLIFVPYQILFNKATREQCGINLKDNIVIIDEAHNLMDTISQIHTAMINLEQLKTCHTQLMNYKMKYLKRFGAKNLLKFNQLIFITKQLLKFLEQNGKSCNALDVHEVLSDALIYNINLKEILKFCEQTRFAAKIHGYSKVHERLEAEEAAVENLRKNATKNLLLELEQKSKKGKSKTVLDAEEIIASTYENQANVIRILLQFIECLAQRYESGRILINHDHSLNETSMKFLLIDPSKPFEPLINDCRSIILAGGTMKPTDELTNQLFRNCKDRIEIHSFGHVVPKKSILPIALSHGCSGKEFLFTHVNRDSDVMMNEVAITIRNICTIIPGGVVCFFTSYDNMNRFHVYLTEKKIIDVIKVKKDVYIEPRNSSKTEQMLDDYAKSIKRNGSSKTGAIIFSVIGGKLSEGMNFSDDLGRCIIIVGLPFPNKSNPELKEKINFISKNVSATASTEYYENLCMKAVNQSVGRAIRHINDYATVLMLDSRYHRQNIIQKLPDWINKSLVISTSYRQAHAEIWNFFKDHQTVKDENCL